MQFLILLIGALVFVFYQFYNAPVFFNDAAIKKVYETPYKSEMLQLEQLYNLMALQKKEEVRKMAAGFHYKDTLMTGRAKAGLQNTEVELNQIRQKTINLIKRADSGADTNDTNYIFLHFVVDYLPKGLVGLLIAIIFLAAWGSIAAALNSLASTTVIDIHQRLWKKQASDKYYLAASRWWTLFWGIFCIAVAEFANRLGSLIEAVNVLGSLFYGTILGIFLIAFYIKKLRGTPTFWAAVVSEIIVIIIYNMDIISFLWLNVIGCGLVIGIACLLQLAIPPKSLNDQAGAKG